MEVQEGSSILVGAELAQEKDFSATSTRAGFAENLELLPTFPPSWAGRQGPWSTDYVKLRQCKLGEMRWTATVVRPDICACLARIASRINALCRRDVYRINGLGCVEKHWRQATALAYASPAHSWKAVG